MAEGFEKFILGARDLAEELGAPKVKSQFVPGGMVRCACDKKNIPFEEVSIRNSDFIRGITDSICRECLQHHLKHTMVVCRSCKAVVARIAPRRYPSGFELRPGAIVHTNACPNCRPDVKMTYLIEKVFFDKRNGYKVSSEILADIGILH